ncbi:hypothetical protein BB559_005720 [Furculomyces boomerangus]|uniref:AMP-dependent synthetase/ligase domain-containing protein n=1 Tax=Furculomyces boomerangus TaxID=61424 RepID=A0A2T9Y719_9FUNG|nr:hypothetical protein BB559_005720 [Furculomyces boomerangus]
MYFKEKEIICHIVPKSEEPGFSPILRHPDNKFTLEHETYTDVNTVYDVFWKAVFEYPTNQYLGYRPYDPITKSFGPYVFLTYEQVGKRITNFGSGLMEVSYKQALEDEANGAEEGSATQSVLDRQWPVAIYSENRIEWSISDRGITSQNLYSTAFIGKNSTEFVPPPFNTKSAEILKHWASELGVTIYGMDEIEEIGSKSTLFAQHSKPKPTDIYTILYTSGTTGNPKGAVSRHGMYAEAAKSAAVARNKMLEGPPTVLSYLPLPHAYGRTVENHITLAGGTIGYYCGDVTKILEDSRALQPTMFPGVPRILTRIYDAIIAATVNAKGLKGYISRMATKQKIDNLLAGKGLKHKLWDALIFNKTRAIISNRLVNITTGTAPLESAVVNFLKIALMSEITEGWAMTETASLGMGQLRGDLTTGNIGVPALCVEIRLRDVPEMDYYVTDMPCARGELLIRSKTLFSEYLRDPENTKSTLLADGWLATGDIARINSNGSVSIIDRKKSIFKTSQGEYIAPEKLESFVVRHPLVLQAFIHGYSIKNNIVGIIVPDPMTFVPWATNILKEAGHRDEKYDFVSLTKNKLVIKKFLEEIEILSKNNKLNGYEIIKGLYLEHEPFDIEKNGILTPTLKLKRFTAINHYKPIMERLYQELEKQK